MSKPSVYHVTASVIDDDYTRSTAVVGACAVGKTEAATLVTDRLTADGYKVNGISDVSRVAAQGTWTPGAVLVYTVKP